MTEQENLLKKNNKKSKEWNHLWKIGLTAFLTFASCILFFFFLFRYEQVTAGIHTVLKAGEPIIIGLVLAYLLLPIKEFVEKWAKKYCKNTFAMNEETAQKAGNTLGIVGALVVLFIVIG